jgi:hypothetical protein
MTKPTISDLPGITDHRGTKPMQGTGWASVSQLHDFFHKLGIPPVTGAELRWLTNVNNSNPMTGKPWIPRPVRGQYEINPTLLGILAHERNKTRRSESARRIFPNQKDFLAQTPYSAEMLTMLRQRGCKCVISGNRVDESIFIESARPVLKAIFSCEPEQIAALGIDKFETVNRNLEEGKLTRERRIEIEMENARTSGRLHDINDVEQRVRMGILKPARDLWQQLVKTYHRLKRTNKNIGNELFETAVPKMLEQLSAIQKQATPGPYHAGHTTSKPSSAYQGGQHKT